MYECDRHTHRHRHRMTAKAALDASIARQKSVCIRIGARYNTEYARLSGFLSVDILACMC